MVMAEEENTQEQAEKVAEPEPKPVEAAPETPEATASEPAKEDGAEEPKIKDAPKAEEPAKQEKKAKAPKKEDAPKAEETTAPEPAKKEKKAKAPKKEETPKAAPAPKPKKTDEAEEPAEPPKKKKSFPKGFEPKLFGKYDLGEIVVKDQGLARYLNLEPVAVPTTGARHANRPFAKTKVSIVERLINGMMRTEMYTGKKGKAYTTVKRAFGIIESKTKGNPVQVLVDALQNTAPREEVTRLRYGGISVPKAVDIAPCRRLDLALRNICKGTVQASYRKKTPIEACLANELLMASKGDINSFAVAKRDEVERVAGSAR